MQNSILDSMYELSRYSFRNYSGITLEKHKGGWRIYQTERWYPTWQKACEAIDKSLRDIKITKP